MVQQNLLWQKKTLKKKIHEGKKQYKDKIEGFFRMNNSKACWDGLKKITGYVPKRNTLCVNDDGNKFVNDLNEFYCRFDCHDFRSVHQNIMSTFNNLSQDDIQECFNKDVVTSLFKKVNIAKASGPDRISGRLVKLCAEQLSFIFCFIFNKSFETHTIPTIWKTSEIVPVPKKVKVDCNNDLRPVALTSIIMKCFEKLILRRLLNQVHTSLDPYQFAYKNARSCEDAVLLMLEKLYHHLDTPKHYARILFIDFSSAFNTIQPHLLMQKLSALKVSEQIQAWVLQFLMDRPQFVRVAGCNSEIRKISTGAPQGCVLSPVLYTIYTNDIRSQTNDTAPFIK